jgi:hypothetical protein
MVVASATNATPAGLRWRPRALRHDDAIPRVLASSSNKILDTTRYTAR